MTDEPTQAEIEALSRELLRPLLIPDPRATDILELEELHRRAALMIARLERAWIEARKPGGARYREALDLIWHIAPLPTQTDQEKLQRIFEVARSELFPRERKSS